MAAPLKRASAHVVNVGKVVCNRPRSNNFFLCENCCLTRRVLSTTNENRSQKKQSDFFGIEEDQGSKNEQAVVGPRSENTNSENRTASMQRLLRSLQNKRKNSEIVAATTYGQVRLDSRATKSSLIGLQPEEFLQAITRPCSESEIQTVRPSVDAVSEKSTKTKKSGQRSTRAEKQKPDKIKNELSAVSHDKFKSNYIADQYFELVSSESENADQILIERPEGEADSNYIEAQYFGTPLSDVSTVHKDHVPEQELNVFETQYFGDSYSESARESIRPITPQDLTIDADGAFQEIDQTQSNHTTMFTQGSDDEQFSVRLAIDQQSEVTYSQPGHGFTQSPLSKQSSEHDQRSVSVSQALETGNFVDEVYFPTLVKADLVPTEKENLSETDLQKSYIEEQFFPHHSKSNRNESSTTTSSTSSYSSNSSDTKSSRFAFADHNPERQIPTNSGHEKFAGSKQTQRPQIENSAYDAALEKRKQLQMLSIGGNTQVSTNKLRVLKFQEQVPDLHRMPSIDVARLLADNVIFENDDFVAVNKPYGLPSHGGPGVRVSVGQLLEQLSTYIDRGRNQVNSLHLVHRLDKETTGAMLLAKNAEVAWQLLGMFRRREVGKVYWTLTKGLPQPLEGVVDIPLARESVRGIYKTVVKPKEYMSEGKLKTNTWSGRGDRSMAAVTEYKVLAHRDNMALVQCRPLSGVQHQIRAHLAQALNTPVLGDHKYSHMDRLAPQKLFPEALQKLGIRQAQVRHVPMHLHAKGLLLPEWRGKTNVFIGASIPRFFLRNLKTLKIKIPPR